MLLLLLAGGQTSSAAIVGHGNITFGMPTISEELAAVPASIVTITNEPFNLVDLVVIREELK